MHHTLETESTYGWCASSAGTTFVILSRSMEKKEQSDLRIVSLAPSATSILCALGAKKTLVGVTKWCADVAPVNDLPKLGDCWHMESVDEILRLKPTLVIGSVPYKQETVARLLKHPLNFLAMNPRTLADIENDIRLLGGITGQVQEASRVVRAMRAGFRNIAKWSKRKRQKFRVYCESWPHPRISSPPWVAELVGLCGGEMIVPSGERVDEKQVAAAKPDVIVLAWAATGDRPNPQRAYDVPEWQELPAIRNRRVYVIKDEWLNTPGPPLVQGAKALQKILHSNGNKPRSKNTRAQVAASR